MLCTFTASNAPTHIPTHRGEPGPFLRRTRLALGTSLVCAWLAGCGGSSSPAAPALPDGSSGVNTSVSPLPGAAGAPPASASGTGTLNDPSVVVPEPGMVYAPGATVTIDDKAPAGMPTDPAGARMGAFGKLFKWVGIPIHNNLLVDGRVVSYGSDASGAQSGREMYAIWDPALGTGAEAFLELPNGSTTDTFCAGATIISTTGEMMLVGGDTTENGVRNYSNADVNFITRDGNTMRREGSMAQKRWYPTLVTLPNNDVIALGGRAGFSDTGDAVAATIPERYTPATKTWSQLSAAADALATGAYGAWNWYYPRAWVAPDSNLFILADSGEMFRLNPEGEGRLSQFTARAPTGSFMLPSILYQRGKILSLRNGRRSVVVDVNGANPTVEESGPVMKDRLWASTALLPDGQVLLTGGSAADNQLVDPVLQGELWNPRTGAWTPVATGSIARLYHSNSLLLPDATVLVSGGGAPGPLVNTNAEIYYPPYLYAADGKPAPRPSITAAPALTTWGANFNITVNAPKGVGSISLMRFGAATHSFNTDQRFVQPAFTETGTQVTITVPNDRNYVLPGYYLIFVLDKDGVPSVARTIRIDA